MLLVLALTLVALCARRVGLGFLVPERMEGDGGVLVRQVELIERRAAEPWRDDCWSYYPHLVARAVAVLTRAEATRPGPEAPLDAHLASASAPHLRVRGVVAWLSVLLVPGTWWLVRRFASRPAALLATAAVAFSPLALVCSQEARPHAPAAAAALLALVAALRLRAKPSLAAYLLAGLAAGLSIATLQSGVAVLLPLSAAHLLRERSGSDAGAKGLARWSARALCLLAPLALAVWIFFPIGSDASPAAGASALFARENGNLKFFGHVVFLDQLNGRGFARIARVLTSFEPSLTLAAMTGLVLWAGGWASLRGARHGLSRDALVVLAYVVPYFLAIGIYERTYERFVLQLLPYLACAAALAFDRWPRVSAPARFFCWAPLILIVPVWTTCATLALRAGSDTADQTARWIAEHAARERVVLVPFSDLPLVRSEAALDDTRKIGWQSPWMSYQRSQRRELPPAPRHDLRTLALGRKEYRDAALSDPMGFLRASGGHVFVVPAVSVLSGDASFQSLRSTLEKHGRLLQRSPALEHVRREDAPLDATDSSAWARRNWTWCILTSQAVAGDVLEIWRLE